MKTDIFPNRVRNDLLKYTGIQLGPTHFEYMYQSCMQMLLPLNHLNPKAESINNRFVAIFAPALFLFPHGSFKKDNTTQLYDMD